MITEDELEYFVDYVLGSDDTAEKNNAVLTDEEMADKVRKIHE